MKTFRLIPLSALLLVAFGAQAQSLIVNGSLNGEVVNMGTPAGWVTLEGTPDTMDATSNVGIPGWLSFAAAPTASPDGGTWVGLGIFEDYVEHFGQSVSGLVVGQTYTVSWEAANFGVNNGANSYLGSNAIGVMLDGVSIGQGATLALSSNWAMQSLTFVASSTSQMLSFRLAGSDTAYMGIDGIKLSMGGATPPVPEPASWALLAVGMVGIGLARRRRG